jgi:hypothetical protein
MRPGVGGQNFESCQKAHAGARSAAIQSSRLDPKESKIRFQNLGSVRLHSLAANPTADVH